MYQAAIEEFTKARDLSEANSETIASLGHAYALSGNQDAARNVLEELKRQSQNGYVPPYNIAMIYAGLGEEDHALDWLEKGYEARDVHMIFLKVDPKWDTFRTNSRFRDLLQRMGFTSGQQ
jgi:Flp pilus assembly protein TadD